MRTSDHVPVWLTVDGNANITPHRLQIHVKGPFPVGPVRSHKRHLMLSRTLALPNSTMATSTGPPTYISGSADIARRRDSCRVSGFHDDNVSPRSSLRTSTSLLSVLRSPTSSLPHTTPHTTSDIATDHVRHAVDHVSRCGLMPRSPRRHDGSRSCRDTRVATVEHLFYTVINNYGNPWFLLYTF